MAKKQRRKSSKINKKPIAEEVEEVSNEKIVEDPNDQDEKIEEESRGKKLLASIDAMSDEEEEENMDDENEEWNAEARAFAYVFMHQLQSVHQRKCYYYYLCYYLITFNI